MDKCIRDTEPGEHKEIFAYADDVAVTVDSVNQLQAVANRWNTSMNGKGMKINTAKGKTEFMQMGLERQEYDIYLGESKICQTESYRYLGIPINSGNHQETEINSRIAKYTSNYMMICPLLKEAAVPRGVKVTIFNTILKPILLYGSEYWALTSRTQFKLQVAEMKVLRVIRGVTKRDRFRKEKKETI